MSFNSSTPSLWDQRPAQDVVHKFTTMAVSSPHGVEGLATGALSPPPPSRSDQAAERITELSRYFFKEIVKKAMTYMEHDRWMEYRSKHLVFALEQFASEVKQQQMRPDYMYLEDNAAIEEENESEGGEEEMEWKEGGEKDEDKECTDDDEEDDDDEAIQEIHDREQEELDAARDLPTAGEREEAENNIFGYDVVIPNVATPQFDELFPPVASNSGTHCLSREILAKTWNATGIRFHRSDLTVYGEDEDAFYGKLNDSLNAYIATMLLEPRSLDEAFANVDD